MRRVIVAIGVLLVLTWVAVVFADEGADGGSTRLDGSWTAARAERDGQPATDVVGNRLSVAGERFEIHAKDGSLLFAGTVKVDAAVTPATIDFVHGEGPLSGKVWKGIYLLGDNLLTVCDNAPSIDRPRPRVFAAPASSGYVVVIFVRQSPTASPSRPS